MSDAAPIVFVVEDDGSFRRSIERLVRAAGFEVEAFASAKDFLLRARPEAPACVILDVRMPGMSGLELQRELSRIGWHIPIIFMTGHGDIPMSVQAMKAGAVEFLTKPFQEQDLLNALRLAIARDRSNREEWTRRDAVQRRYETLTVREKEVMALVVAGRLNKQIAAVLGTSEKTIKFHRGHMVQKMKADSVAELVRMAERLEAAGVLLRPPLA